MQGELKIKIVRNINKKGELETTLKELLTKKGE